MFARLRFSAGRRGLLRWGLILAGWGGAVGGAAGQGPVVLRTAEEVRRLTTDQAAEGRPVELQGVLTFFDQKQFSRFVQDGTAGIYLTDFTGYPELKAGDEVRVTGRTDAGEYAPVVRPLRVERLGRRAMPVARPVVFEDLASGREDSQWVEMSGVVRQEIREGGGRTVALDLATGGGRLRLEMGAAALGEGQEWVDCVVRGRGVCSSSFNRGRQLFRSRLLVPQTEDLVVEKRPAANAFEQEVRPLGSLLRFAPQGTLGHRIKVKGTVVYQGAGVFYLDDGKQGLLVKSDQSGPLGVGEVVEALGFPVPGDYTPVLEDAVWRKVGQMVPPVPSRVAVDELLQGAQDCRLVELEGRLLERTVRAAETQLVMESEGGWWSVLVDTAPGRPAMKPLENGSWLRVTGICRVEVGQDWQAGKEWRARGFHVLARGAGDLTVLKSPPWWTLQRLLWMAGALLASAVSALACVGLLRRQVKGQTRIIEEQWKREARLRERYQSLFENADDMVYTHDAEGRLTSMNPAGSQLLERSVESLTGLPLLELIAPEQCAGAAEWIRDLCAGQPSQAAEWDMLTPAGRRVRVEIHPRPIAGPQGSREVEGIARDVTEQRRLEREVLEVSTREQRRIAHDLHDGVCQQLAGLAYLADILADCLEHQHAGEAGDARQISERVNRVNQQARNVARGLFPVALEENGLASALTELTIQSGAFFRIRCTFAAPVPVTILDGIVAHHLFYIAQEAIQNAARHGKPGRIEVTLAPDDGRYRLMVSDDGIGLPAGPARSESMGLRIMHYRARQIGASLEVKLRAGGGTLVSCSFPPVQTGPPGGAGVEETVRTLDRQEDPPKVNTLPL